MYDSTCSLMPVAALKLRAYINNTCVYAVIEHVDSRSFSPLPKLISYSSFETPFDYAG